MGVLNVGLATLPTDVPTFLGTNRLRSKMGRGGGEGNGR